MKKLLLATVAAAAISFPAMAAQQNNPSSQSNMPNKSSTQSEQSGTTGQGSSSMQKSQSGTSNQGSSDQNKMSNESANPSSSQSAQQTINPDRLDQSQVRQIQQALDKKGFEVGKTDGKWGPETEAALRKFQQDQKMSSPGQLDEQTLTQLGLNASQFTSQTTGQGGQMNNQSSGQNQNNEPMKNQSSGTSGQSGQNNGNMKNGNYK